MLIVLDALMVALMVLLPATLLVFYSLKSVRATCRASGLVQTSTTAAAGHAASQPPVSVILLAVWECLGVLAVFSLLIVRASVVFGIVVRGPGAILLLTTHAALSGIAAWLVYRRVYLGWAISLFKNVFWVVSWLATLLSRDLIEIYREMGLSEQQLQIFRQLPYFRPMVFVSTFAGFTVFLVLILYTKRFFSRTGAGPEEDHPRFEQVG